ncbi:hypothetical protein [Cyanobium sp. LEGE 06143]|uniref:hypothetical protein n=1 Tax=Cyanobium sp. LEGE 06143 TaxID=945727 RepID=UPI001D149298|nr:hypothetical protein [Cyanobium sp. LEGE 06143]
MHFEALLAQQKTAERSGGPLNMPKFETESFGWTRAERDEPMSLPLTILEDLTITSMGDDATKT